MVERLAWTFDRAAMRDCAQKLVDEKRRALEAMPSVQAAAVTGDASATDSVQDGDFERNEIDAGASIADSGLSMSSSMQRLHRSSEAAQLRAMRLQQELLLREAEECTFHPRTNSRMGVGKTTNPEAFYQRTQQWAEQITHENDERRRRLEERTMSECTFAPNVALRRETLSMADSASTDGLASGIQRGDVGNAVVSRLYHPQARMAQHEALDRKREERRQQEEAECSFRPHINKPLRNNVATNVPSRYRRPSPAKRLPLPTGEEQCTFSPAVNRTPRKYCRPAGISLQFSLFLLRFCALRRPGALSHAVADYLDDPAHLRLSRQPPPSPRDGVKGTRGMGRSASAPRMRAGAHSENVPSTTSISQPGFTPRGEQMFAYGVQR